MKAESCWKQSGPGNTGPGKSRAIARLFLSFGKVMCYNKTIPGFLHFVWEPVTWEGDEPI